MRESTVHRRLEGECAAMHIPRAILQLGLQEKTPSALNCRMRVGHSRADVERIHGLAGGVGVALRARQLRPAAICALLREERFRQRL